MKTHIVIPIGVGAPGTPVQEYLESSVNSILSQTISDYVLTIAADTDIPERCKEFLESKSIDVKWFSPHTYFRKGGIWKKIFDTWRDTETENVAFLHYDDIWDSKKLEIQHSVLEKGKSSCWSETYMIDRNGSLLTSDCSWDSLSGNTVGSRTMAFAHSVVVSRKHLFESGILELEEKWAANFEDVWALYVHKIGNSCKAHGAKFFWRNHEMSISNTVTENAEFVKAQRSATQYTLSETFSDADQTFFQDLVMRVKQFYT